MPEMNAVVGTLSDSVAKRISSKGGLSEPLEIKLDNNMYVRVQPGDVAGVLSGASKKGETSVQVLLKENATVETFARGKVADFLKPIRDFGFFNFTIPVNKIFVSPQVADKLLDLNRLK